jgi:acetyl-CoA acetyltransferase
MTRHIGERDVVISGVGRSAVGRRLQRADLDLTIDAALAAVADAGLVPSDIDGLSTYKGEHPGPRPGGYYDDAGPPAKQVQDALRLDLGWWSSSNEGAGQYIAVVNAIAAVSAGLARHVLVYRTQTESSARMGSHWPGLGLEGSHHAAPWFEDWAVPMHLYGAVNFIALFAQRYAHAYGLEPDQLAQIALTARRHAEGNPHAVYREPMTIEQYFESPMVSTPLRLFDCDVPIDGSFALVVSHRDHAPDTPHGGTFVNAMGVGLRYRSVHDQFEDMTTMALDRCAAQLWERSSLRVEDVDVAYPYDGFSIIALCWLESLGLCGRGEAGAFVEGGHRIGLDGELPINTDGGHLSAGRTSGYGAIHEAVLQLRGAADRRQVPGAEVAVVTTGGGSSAQGCFLLTRGHHD